MAPSWELSVSLCYWKIRYSTVAVTWVRLWCCNHPLSGNVSMLYRPSSKPGSSILYQSIPCMELPWDRDEAMQKEPVLKETKTFAYTTHLHVLALPKPIVFLCYFYLMIDYCCIYSPLRIGGSDMENQAVWSCDVTFCLFSSKDY